jgi:hypothetical protein
MEENKQKIINLFLNNVKGINICLDDIKNHCGKEGYWLEEKMGIKHNDNNEPDIYGYEMKKMSNKITLGDFSANEYAFSGKNKRNILNEYNQWDNKIIFSKLDFLKCFGNPNINKNNRYSWSGICVPIYNKWNTCGQILEISDNNDINIYYSYDYDLRERKINFPEYLKNKKILIVHWKHDKLEQNINNKFNIKGFFICKKLKNKYETICFGKPFNYNYFIEGIKNNKIYFDSGMYEGNRRNYSHFRSSQVWKDLIIEEY